ncbi:MAG: hypothetical protein HC860_12860 [Alkalinema sp. RU_4_3]|nr:hypothetical protein [Alkalinema sp. RU_4_3]
MVPRTALAQPGQLPHLQVSDSQTLDRLLQAEATLLQTSKPIDLALPTLDRLQRQVTVQVMAAVPNYVPYARFDRRGLFPVEAQKLLTQWQQRYPQSGILAAMQLDRLAEDDVDTNAVVRQALQQHPDHPLVKRAALQWANSDLAPQIALPWLDANPRNLAVYQAVLERQTIEAEVLATFDRAIAQMPDQPETYLSLMQAFVDRGLLTAEVDPLLERLAIGQRKFPQNPEFDRLAGELNRLAERYPQAMQAAQQGLRKPGNPGKLYRLMGDLEIARPKGQTKLALDYYQKAVKAGADFCDIHRPAAHNALEDSDRRAYWQLNVDSIVQGNSTMAAQNICFTNLWSVTTSGLELSSSEWRSQGIALGRRMLPTFDSLLAEDMTIARNNELRYSAPGVLMEWLMREKDYSGVLEIGQKLLPQRQNWVNLHLMMGIAYENLGQLDQAEKAYLAAEQRSLALSSMTPGEEYFAKPRWHLGRLQQKRGNLRAAKQEYQRAIAGFDATYRDYLAGQPETETYHALALNDLGEIALKEGDRTQAKQYFERSVAVSPGLTAAQENLAKLR